FFEQPVLQDGLGQYLLERSVLVAQRLHFRRRRFACRVSQQPLLACLEKLLAPAVVQVRRQSLAPTEFCDAFLASQALEDDPNLLFGRKAPPRTPVDLPDDLLCTHSLAHPGLLRLGWKCLLDQGRPWSKFI